MSASRQVVERSLRAAIDEHLRPRGFRGSLPHLRRRGEDQVCLVSVQFRMGGGSLAVEVAECPAEGFTTSWGEHVPADKVTARDIASPRPRLGSPTFPSGDRWWHFDASAKRCDAIAAEVVRLVVRQAEPWWREQLELRSPG
ncbi:MAG TPA: DUF4304 domain-containing protein [Nocardioides sp.]|nr:DUF4304 domain-containing protein [Nocardioides sp.]